MSANVTRVAKDIRIKCSHKFYVQNVFFFSECLALSNWNEKICEKGEKKKHLQKMEGQYFKIYHFAVSTIFYRPK